MKCYCNPEPDTTWPVPLPETDEDKPLVWRLLWGTPTGEDLCAAASFINAYECLVLATISRRNKICKAVREQMKANDVEAK